MSARIISLRRLHNFLACVETILRLLLHFCLYYQLHDNDIGRYGVETWGQIVRHDLYIP